MSDDPTWTPERRAILVAAIRKAQAGCEQREAVRMTGAEAVALYKAAQAWEDMMVMIDGGNALRDAAR